ncbi:tyrosine-type recombinase/integrase [Paraburkholderia atlantica]|uniref:tyrosine-type recombinase/integrase n=1 Tax=Paraburkholderia atlantica TaxID=2654982 RepID=UPI00160DDC95|nr:tyrosine-type recombinase/integrase [Paraburkholderia atlantica]MBB5414037.1 integrase [Paraburkholderia atlantica]
MAAARRRIASRRSWPPNLYKNSQGYYWFKDPESKKTFGLGADFRLASAQARTANAELERRKGAVSLIQRIDGADDSLESWCVKYEAKRQTGNKNTLSGMRSQLKAIREAPFAQQSMCKIKPKEISTFITEAAESRGPAMAGDIRTRLHDLFREAIKDGLVEVGKNPVEVIEKPQRTITRQRLTLDDFNEILAKAEANPRYCWVANAMKLALVTGQRREDVAAMRFDHAKDGFLWVEQTKGRSKGNIVKLRIPLDLRLDAVNLRLSDVLKQCRDNVATKNVIHYVRANATIRPGDSPKLGSISEGFAKFRDEAEIAVEDGKQPPSFHEIRSLAARLYTEQYDAEFAQALLGHKSAAMTARYRDARGVEWSEIKVSVR